VIVEPAEAILDANAIIGLAKGEVLDLLARLYWRVSCPSEVVEEVCDPVSARALVSACRSWLRIATPSDRSMSQAMSRFGHQDADRAVVALALDRPDAETITGDKAIATYLRLCGRRIVVPEGVVVAMKLARLTPAGGPVLRRMMGAGYCIRAGALSALLSQLDEDPTA